MSATGQSAEGEEEAPAQMEDAQDPRILAPCDKNHDGSFLAVLGLRGPSTAPPGP